MFLLCNENMSGEKIDTRKTIEPLRKAFFPPTRKKKELWIMSSHDHDLPRKMGTGF